MAFITFSPTAGEFYNAADGIRFHLKQKIITSASYIACDQRVLSLAWEQTSSTIWTMNLRKTFDVLPFPNEPLDDWIDLDFTNDVKLDFSALTQPTTITVPIATSTDDLTVDFPTGNYDPPIIRAFNPTDSFSYTIGYNPGTATSYDDAGKFSINPSLALTFLRCVVNMPDATTAANTGKFYNRLRAIKSTQGVWSLSMDRQLRKNNITGEAQTY